MKLLKYTTVISIILLFTSCSITKKLTKSITGEWKITNLKTDNSEKVNEAVIKLTSNMLKGSFINFKKDKTYEISVLGKLKKGTWQISEDGKKILTSEKGKYFEIISFSENTLTLKSYKSKKAVIMILQK